MGGIAKAGRKLRGNKVRSRQTDREEFRESLRKARQKKLYIKKSQEEIKAELCSLPSAFSQFLVYGLL